MLSVRVPDDIYYKFRLITDRSECGKLLTRDLKDLFLNVYLNELCAHCFCCGKTIPAVSPSTQIVYVSERYLQYFSCKGLCASNLNECVSVCRDFGDYD